MNDKVYATWFHDGDAQYANTVMMQVDKDLSNAIANIDWERWSELIHRIVYHDVTEVVVKVNTSESFGRLHASANHH